MDFIKRIYLASVVISLTFFAACGDSDSSSADITSPDNQSGSDITDTTSRDTAATVNNSSATGDSTATKDSTTVKDSSSVKSSSSVDPTSSANSILSSSSGDNSTFLSSSINSNETAEGCIVRPDTTAWRLVNKDTIYWRYSISCDGVVLGSLRNESDKNLPIAADGQSCTLNDHLDGNVDIICGSNTYTTKKDSKILGQRTYTGPELVSCKDTDLWCHSPIIDGANSTPISQITYKEAEGFFFSNTGTHDLTDWEGICITYTSDADVDIILDLGEAKNQELNNNLPQVTLANKTSLPIQKCFAWSSFKQPRWASPAISGDDAAKTVASLKIKQPSENNFKLIRLKAYRGYSNTKPSGLTCAEMWCADEVEDIVRTGCGKEEVGVWRATTDASSSVIWPEELGSEYDPNSVIPVIEKYFSVAGTFTLGNTEKPYAKIGFDLDYESTENFDITQWGGFCLTYKSTHDFYAELAPFNAADGQEVPRVLIPKSLDEKTVDLSWSSFNPADASSVNFINFVFSEPAGSTGYFGFYTVGRAGTCTR